MVTFDGSGSTDNIGITKHTWSFDDEGTLVTLIGINPAHVFSAPGNYNITLNVTDAIRNYDTHTVLIKVLDVTKPVAKAGSDQTVKVGATVHFDASASTDNVGIQFYEWDFGDGTTDSHVYPFTTHTYTNPGNYTVTLTVKDAAGNSDTNTINVIVEAEFPWWIAGVVVAGIVVVIIFYLTKLRKTTLQ